MPLPVSLSAYKDVRSTLDTVVNGGQYPARLTFANRSEATAWRARANQLRVLLRRSEEGRLTLAQGEGTSPYDDLVFRIDNNAVTVHLRPPPPKVEVGGTILDPAEEEALLAQYDYDDPA